jgi:hypothetical protein
MIESAWSEIGKTARYALVSNERTARLAMLITLFGVLWWLLML